MTQRYEGVGSGSGVPDEIAPKDDLHARVGSNTALAAGVPLKVVSDRLGHSTFAITANLYTHVSPAVAREAADAIARSVPHRHPA